MLKRLTAAVSAAVTACVLLAAMPAGGAAAIPGDLNCDDEITVADAVLMSRLMAEDPSLQLTAEARRNADYDTDGLLCMTDLRAVLSEAERAGFDPPVTAATSASVTTAAAVTTVSTASAAASSSAAEITLPPLYTEIGSLLIAPYPFAVRRNEVVTLCMIGQPNTVYNIEVYYSSGPSTAKGLEPHLTDSSGYTEWTWKIGGKTNSGNYHIDLTGGGETTVMPFSVVD